MSPANTSPDAGTRAWAEVDLAAIVPNYGIVRGRVGTGRRVICAVKADAYGHGATPVSQALLSAGAEMLAVATVAEGAELRAAGIQAPILVLSATLPEQAQAMLEHDLRPVVCTVEFAQAMSAAAASRGVEAVVHVKVDTGMGRVGVPDDRAVPFVRGIAGLPALSIEGICTHFAVAGRADKSYTLGQLERYTRVVDALDRVGVHIPVRHTANSAAILDIPTSHFNAVRPGMVLYGCYGSPQESRTPSLREALTLKARVTFIKDVPIGTSISYGRTFVTERPSRIATLPIGYGDGFDRRFSNNTDVLLHGRRAPLVGRVCMDQCMVDVTDLPGVQVGDEAVLYGRQEQECISIEDAARQANSIPHVILCNIGRRVPRVYVG